MFRHTYVGMYTYVGEREYTAAMMTAAVASGSSKEDI